MTVFMENCKGTIFFKFMKWCTFSYCKIDHQPLSYSTQEEMAKN